MKRVGVNRSHGFALGALTSIAKNTGAETEIDNFRRGHWRAGHLRVEVVGAVAVWLVGPVVGHVAAPEGLRS